MRSNATAAEQDDWGQSFFNTVLQKRPSLEQLRQWNTTFIAAFEFIKREKSKVSDRSRMGADSNRKKIVEKAVSELWSNQDFVTLEAIAPLAKSKTTCTNYGDASSLADCAGIGLFSRGSQKLLDPSYGNRYAALANDFVGYVSQLRGFEGASLSMTLLSEFFGSFSSPIWAKCDSTVFGQKASALRSQIGFVVGTSDQVKKWEVERQIKETLKDCG